MKRLTLAPGPKSPPRPGPTPLALSSFLQTQPPIPLSSFLQSGVPRQPPKVLVKTEPRGWTSAATSALQGMASSAATGLAAAAAAASSNELGQQAVRLLKPPVPGNRGAQSRTAKELGKQVEQTLQTGKKLQQQLGEGLDRVAESVEGARSAVVSEAKKVGDELGRAGRFAIEALNSKPIPTPGVYEVHLPPAVEVPEPPPVPFDPRKAIPGLAALKGSTTQERRLPAIQQLEYEKGLQTFVQNSANYHGEKAMQQVLQRRDQEERSEKEELQREKDVELIKGAKGLLKQQTSAETVRQIYDRLHAKQLSRYAEEQLFIEPDVFRRLEKVQQLRKTAETFYATAQQKLQVLQPKLRQLELLQTQIQQNEQQRDQIIKEIETFSENPFSTAEEVEEKEEMLMELQKVGKELKQRAKDWSKISSTIKELTTALETVPESVELSSLIFRRILFCALGDPECESLVALIEEKMAQYTRVRGEFHGLGRKTRRKRVKSRKFHR